MESKTVHATLTRLYELYHFVLQLDLDAENKALLCALILKEIGRVERRQAKMLAKAVVSGTEESEGTEPAVEAEASVADAEGDEGGAARPTDAGQVGDAGGGLSAGSPEEPASSASDEPKPKGHGRNGAGAYVNAKHVHHALLAGTIGSICQACGMGPMTRYREKLIVSIKGQPLFDALIHHFEQARCKLCGAIIRAEGATEVAPGLGSSYITYDWFACAMLLVMHYFAGLPFKRIEGLQAAWGIPMPDANQWSLVDACTDRLLPLCHALERHGVRNAITLRIDDTGAMIIETRREIRAEIADLEASGESTKDVRTGINTTGVYIETEQGKVLLFFTGLHHAGEIIDRILKHRSSNGPKLVKVTDAASKNFSHAHRDEFEEAVCNAHAYLKFRAVKDAYPEEHRLAGEVYKKVFDNDDVTKAQGMSPRERMLYHQKHSLPEMERLKKMCSEKLLSKLVEPNSPLWEPISFIINQWDRLTKFCRVPGIPLDTNVVEQMLIIPVRYLAASFNYQSTTGAEVGDLSMSLIASANANGIEPVAYLAECLANHEDLAERPEHYLPWAYRARLEARERSGQTGPPSAGPNRPSKSGKDIEHALRPGTRGKRLDATAEPPSVVASP